MVKKVIAYIINAISIILIALAVVILLTVVFTKKEDTPNILGYSAFRVLTPSMEPTLPVDTLVVTKSVDPETIQIDDIITFYSADEEILGQINTHRVIGFEEYEGERIFVTKGDANYFEDDARVYPEYLIGKVVWQSKLWGKLVSLAANPIIFGLFIVVPLLFILVTNIVQAVKSVKDIQKEEMEEEIARLKKIVEEKEAQVAEKKDEETVNISGDGPENEQ